MQSTQVYEVDASHKQNKKKIYRRFKGKWQTSVHWISSFHCWIIWNVSIFDAFYFQRWLFSSNPSNFLRVYSVPSFNLFAHECINIIDRHSFISWTLNTFACIFVLCTAFFLAHHPDPMGKFFFHHSFCFLFGKWVTIICVCIYTYRALHAEQVRHSKASNSIHAWRRQRKNSFLK